MRTTRRTHLLLLVLLAVVINLPVAHGSWTDRQVRRDGVDVTATVVRHEVLRPGDDPAYAVLFALPPEVDAQEREFRVVVDRATYDAAVATDLIEVRVLPDRPNAFLVPGQATSRVVLWFTLLADLVLLTLAALVWRFGGSTGARPRLRLVAVADVQLGRPGGSLEREGELWVACGEVVERSADHVVLDVGGDRVEVDLAGHANPIGYQQPARVTGREQ